MQLTTRVLPIRKYLLIAMFMVSGAAWADWGSGGMYIDDSRLGEFLSGKSWSRPNPAEKAKPTAPAKTGEPEKPAKQKVTLAWLREHFVEFDQRAQENPTKENLEAVMYLKRVLFDKGQNYATRYREVLAENPMVDENTRIPYASSAQAATIKVNGEAIQKANMEMAEVGGLWIFVDAKCEFCKGMLGSAALLKKYTGMPILVVAIDGQRPPGYSETLGPLVTDNGMFKTFGLKLTPSVVYVYKPDVRRGLDNTQFLVVAQGFYQLDQLQRSIAYAGYRSVRDRKEFAGMLSADTVRGLDAWNKGVLSVKDLDDIQIDPNDPASIKRAIEPYLEKSMRTPGNTRYAN